MKTTPDSAASGTGRPPVSPTLALLLMVVVWAVNFTIAKVALETISPLAFNALRFPCAAAVVIAALAWRGSFPLPERRHRARVLWLALLGNVVYQQFFIFGLNLTRAGTASVLLAGAPIATALLSAILGHERVGWRTWAGVLATVAGIALVVGTADQAGGSLLGDLLMILAAFSWAGYTVGARPLVEHYGAVPVTAWTLSLGTVFVVLAGIPDLLRTDIGALSAGSWLAIVYAGALSIGLAYLIWNYGVRHLGNTRTAVFSNLVPVVALAVAWVWLDEVPLPRQMAGAAVIIAGVSLVQARRLVRHRRSEPGGA